MKRRHRSLDIDVFGDEDLPRKAGFVWPEEEDLTGQLGRPRHDAHALIRDAEQAGRRRAAAVKRARGSGRRATDAPASPPRVGSGYGPITGDPREIWAMPDTHPAAGQQYALGRVRHVVVKARYRLNGPRGNAGAVRGQPLQKHLVYLARPEAQREPEASDLERAKERESAGEPASRERAEGTFFDAAADAAEVSALPQAWRRDRHHWRLIVSPDDAEQLDLRAFARATVARIEQHLGTDLEWVGIVHVNTGHRHLHVLIRGKRDDGRDLTLPRETVSQTLRELAEDELRERLGLRGEREAEAYLAEMAKRNRPTPLDELLHRIATNAGGGDAGISFRLPDDWVPEACGKHHLRQRLETLERLGLAKRDVRQAATWGGVDWWTLKPDWQDKLALMKPANQLNSADTNRHTPSIAVGIRTPLKSPKVRTKRPAERGGAEL